VRPGIGAEYFPDAFTLRRLQVQGALVGRVTAGGPAAKAGLQPTQRDANGDIQWGDLIVALDGQAVESVEGFLTSLESHEVGSEVTLTIVRDLRTDRQRQLDVRVTLGQAEEE
jgi:S1-C subfamily serine protease